MKPMLALCLTACTSQVPMMMIPDAGGSNDAGVPADAAIEACAPLAQASLCTPANDASVIRGVARFDPAHFAPGADVALQLFLFHQFVLDPSEATTGGHPHV